MRGVIQTPLGDFTSLNEHIGYDIGRDKEKLYIDIYTSRGREEHEIKWSDVKIRRYKRVLVINDFKIRFENRDEAILTVNWLRRK